MIQFTSIKSKKQILVIEASATEGLLAAAKLIYNNRVDQLCYITKMEYYTAMKMDETQTHTTYNNKIILNKKNIYSMIPGI